MQNAIPFSLAGLRVVWEGSSMTMLVAAMIFALILCWMAFQANMRFQNESRLPMQWWLTGEVTWSAPRRLALAFIPALATGVFTIYIIMSLTVEPRVGQEVLVLPTLVGLGAMFIAVQLAHFWLITKTLRRNDS